MFAPEATLEYLRPKGRKHPANIDFVPFAQWDDLPSLEHVSKVVVDEAVINGQAEPYLIYRGNMQNRAASE